jgi:lysophospholipase L1-like esterase
VSVRARLATAFLLACSLACNGCSSSTGPSATPGPDSGSDDGAGFDGGVPPGDSSPPDASTPDADASSVVPGGVRFLGRVDTSNPTTPKFAWSATGLVATVGGAKISVKLASEGSDAFFQPVVDGTPGTRFSVANGMTQTVTLATGLAAGDHTVELYRESEGMFGDSVFLGFVDGTLIGAPASSGRLIEVIGDSISAGYGNLGMETHPPWTNTCMFSLATESAYASYASVLGRSLNAEVSILAHSGWGMVRDLGGSTSGVLSSIYDDTLGTQASPKWAFARTADAVVINLGTNDSGPGDPGKPYEDAYVAFLKTIRGHYPNAWIFLTLGPMTSDPMLTTMRTHLANVVAAAADARVMTVNIDTQDATSTGCDYHPNVAEDTKMAQALVPTMRGKLGW